MTGNDPRVVVICGGTGSVGLATAREFAAEGVSEIVLVGRDEAKGADALRSANADGHTGWRFVSADLSDPDAARRAMVEAAAHRGRLDVLVTSVRGGSRPVLVHEMDSVDLAAAITEQLFPPLYASHAALPMMRGHGSGAIVLVASDAAKVATPGEAAIGAAMAAIVMFAKTLAVEAKRDGIRVNAVTPSIIANSGGYDAVMSDPFSARLFGKALPLAKLGVPEPSDLAQLIVFLAGSRAARITGQAVSVNGGISVA